jgi:hypothetical protein
MDLSVIQHLLMGAWASNDVGRRGSSVWLTFDACGRALQFIYSATGLETGSALRLRYCVESDTILRFTYHNSTKSWLRRFHLQGDDMLELAKEDESYRCSFTRVAPGDLPAWYEGACTMDW